MKILLDTQVVLWFYLGDPQLSQTALSAIVDADNVKLVSPAADWELAIKVSLGKYVLTERYNDFIQHAIGDNGFGILPVEPRHTAALVDMPYHHKDPFDRLIVAQANVEGLSIVSNDFILDRYQITRVW